MLVQILKFMTPWQKKKTIYNDIKLYWRSKKAFENITILDKVKPENLEDDITVIITEWDEFKGLDYSKTKLFDGRYIISNEMIG